MDKILVAIVDPDKASVRRFALGHSKEPELPYVFAITKMM